MTLQTYQPPPAATSPQEAEKLIGFVGEATRTIAEIDADLARDIDALTRAAEARSRPVKEALADAQAKIETWARTHPDHVRLMGAGGQVIDPLDAQRAAALMASARPISPRQRAILVAMRDDGCVLRRQYNRRSYSVLKDGKLHAPYSITTNHVFDLQGRFLDAHDAKTGELLLGASAYDTDPALEFRLKPDAVLS